MHLFFLFVKGAIRATLIALWSWTAWTMSPLGAEIIITEAVWAVRMLGFVVACAAFGLLINSVFWLRRVILIQQVRRFIRKRTGGHNALPINYASGQSGRLSAGNNFVKMTVHGLSNFRSYTFGEYQTSSFGFVHEHEIKLDPSNSAAGSTMRWNTNTSVRQVPMDQRALEKAFRSIIKG